jgi:predicted amino acid dehydrogenase
MGRTGAFLASSLISLKGDYYTLSKSLGGGLAKVAATLIRRSQYRWEFSLLHSSTFAEDEFSCQLALKTLDLLEDQDGAAYRRIRTLGETLYGILERLRQDYPDVIAAVRGTGLMLGIEFADQAMAYSRILRTTAHVQSLGYLIAGYLLRAASIRVAPCASNPNVVRIEPSMYLDDAELARIDAALRQVCTILRQQDTLHLVFPLIGAQRPCPRTEIRDFRTSGEVAAPLPPVRTVRKVAFINHLISPEWLVQAEPALAGLTPEELRTFVLKMAVDKRTAPFDPVRIRSPLGAAVDFILYPLCVVSEQMVGYLTGGELDGIRKDIQERLDTAKADGCEVAGLGMYTSIVTNNATALQTDGIAVTSGNALTIAMGLQAVEQISIDAGIELQGATLVMVGAAGNIAATYAALLAQRVGRIILLGSDRDGSVARLNRTAHGIYEALWQALRTNAARLEGHLGAALQELSEVRRWLATSEEPGRDVGRRLAEAVRATYQEDPFIGVTTNTDMVRHGDLVVCVANTDRPFLTATAFKEGAIVCDIAVPNNVVPAVTEVRPDLHYLQGGIVATPYGESLAPSARAFLGTGELFACMAETAVMGLAGISQHYSYGPVSPNQVREIAALAKLHGFRLAGTKQAQSY